MIKNKKIAFIGAGNMGQALVKGLLKKGIIESRDIMVSDLDKEKLRVAGELGVTIAKDSGEAVEKGEIVILSVKPKDIEGVLKGIAGVFKPAVPPFPLIISIAAGITTAYIEERLGKDIPVVRVMPNTPALVGEGISAVSRGRFASELEEGIAEEIFRAVGDVVKVREELMDAVTALSGSGPAYVFAVMENMVEAGIKEELSPELARRLVSQTVLGAVRMAMETGEELSVLRKMVTSPGGTTAAALQVFKRKGLGEILAEGIKAAAKRAEELSSQS